MKIESKEAKILKSFLLSIYLQIFIFDIFFFILNIKKLISNFEGNYLINLILPITILFILSLIVVTGFFSLFKKQFNTKNIIYAIFYKWTSYIKLDNLLKVKSFSFVSFLIYEILISFLMIFSSFFWILLGVLLISQNMSLGMILLIIGILISLDWIIWIAFKILNLFFSQKTNCFKAYEKYVLIFSWGFGWTISIYQFILTNERKIEEDSKRIINIKQNL